MPNTSRDMNGIYNYWRLYTTAAYRDMGSYRGRAYYTSSGLGIFPSSNFGLSLFYNAAPTDEWAPPPVDPGK